MKKALIIPLLGLVMASCSSDPGDGPNGEQNTEEVNRSFITVTLMSPHAVTRGGYIEDGGIYEDGKDYENNVQKIRFYFFDEDGSSIDVSKSGDNYYPYIDWTPTVGSEKDPEGSPNTVEKIVTANLTLTQPANTDRPSQVLAVINPPSFLTESIDPALNNLVTLRNYVANYLDDYTNKDPGNFVITNSVYMNSDSENREEVCATQIDPVNNFGDANNPPKEPIIIYVERVVARIDFSLNLTNPSLSVNGETIYKVSEQKIGGDETDIYVKLLGWNLTQTPNCSRLVKAIDSEWPLDLFGTSQGEPWFIPQYHRSFWAVNPGGVECTYYNDMTFQYQYGPFGTGLPDLDNAPTYDTASSEKIPTADNPVVTVYTQENAADYITMNTGEGPEKPTEFIIAGRLVDKEGKTLSLLRWHNRYYSEVGALNSIIQSINLDIYKASSAKDEQGNPVTRYTHISADDLKLVAASEVPNLNQKVPTYYKYAQLTPAAQEETWYEKTSDGKYVEFTKFEEVNKELLNSLNYFVEYEGGDVYYFKPILHLGAAGEPGYEGIVRNHIYKVNVTLIEGLGTPVINDYEDIHPEEPDDDEFNISAQVNILQWRVVKQDYELTW